MYTHTHIRIRREELNALLISSTTWTKVTTLMINISGKEQCEIPSFHRLNHRATLFNSNRINTHVLSEVVVRYFKCNQLIQACIQWKRILNHQTVIGRREQRDYKDSANLRNTQHHSNAILYKLLIKPVPFKVHSCR